MEKVNKIVRKILKIFMTGIILYGVFYFNSKYEFGPPRKRCPGCPGNYFEFEQVMENSAIEPNTT